MKSEYKTSKKYIGEVQALEHRDNPHDLKLFGKGGFITRSGLECYTAYITQDAFKLRTPIFSELQEEQRLPVSKTGLAGMIKHLKIPSKPARQLEYYRDIFKGKIGY